MDGNNQGGSRFNVLFKLGEVGEQSKERSDDVFHFGKQRSDAELGAKISDTAKEIMMGAGSSMDLNAAQSAGGREVSQMNKSRKGKQAISGELYQG